MDKYYPVFDFIRDKLTERKLFDTYSEVYYREKLRFYYLQFLIPWTAKTEKTKVKNMLKELLANTENDYCKYDFTRLYGMRRSVSFVMNYFCRWINGSIFYGMVYYSLVRANKIKKSIKAFWR